MLQYMASIIGFITASLYVVGSAYWYSYLDSMAIPPVLFNLSFEDTLVQGFLAFIVIGLPLVMMLFLGGLTLLGVAYNLNETSKISWVQKLISFLTTKSRTKLKEEGHPVTEGTVSYSKKVVALIGSLLLLLSLVFAMLSEADKVARASGASKLQSLVTEQGQQVFLSDGSVLNGSLVTCGNIMCAIYDGTQMVVVAVGEIEKIATDIDTTAEGEKLDDAS